MVSTTLELNSKEYKKVSIFHRFLHNRRLHQKCKNSIFDTKYNYVKNFIEFSEEKDVFDEEEKLKKFVKKVTKRKSQIENHILETTINISNDEEITNLLEEELQKFLIEKTEKHIEFLKEKYGIKIYQFSLHMDEGHYDENNEIKKNIHIHLIHSNVTNQGKSFTREIFQINKKNISILQDYVSQNFQLSRGKLNSERKHLDKEDYKQMIIQRKLNRKKETQKIIDKVKNKENKLLEDFETKKKEIEILEFEQFLKHKDKKYQEEITKLRNDIDKEKTKLREDFIKERNKKRKELNEVSTEKDKEHETKIQEKMNIIQNFLKENETLKTDKKTLTEVITKLNTDITTVNTKYDKKIRERNFLNWKLNYVSFRYNNIRDRISQIKNVRKDMLRELNRFNKMIKDRILQDQVDETNRNENKHDFTQTVKKQIIYEKSLNFEEFQQEESKLLRTIRDIENGSGGGFNPNGNKNEIGLSLSWNR